MSFASMPKIRGTIDRFIALRDVLPREDVAFEHLRKRVDVAAQATAIAGERYA